MNAKVKNSIAVLEEYIQEYYIENFENFSSSALSKVELIKTKKNEWFFNTKEGFVVDSGNHTLYLIVKKNLPKEIREQLVGGDAGEGTYEDYFYLNDVYGVTSDLKVYYCSKRN